MTSLNSDKLSKHVVFLASRPHSYKRLRPKNYTALQAQGEAEFSTLPLRSPPRLRRGKPCYVRHWLQQQQHMTVREDPCAPPIACIFRDILYLLGIPNTKKILCSLDRRGFQVKSLPKEPELLRGVHQGFTRLGRSLKEVNGVSSRIA